MEQNDVRNVRASYDLIADEYVRNIYDELKDKPLDRELLDRFATDVRDLGPVCDVGAGPGHVARYLHERGVKVCGIDLSDAMVERARRLNPGIDFKQGNMLALEVADETFAAITAFYAVVNIARTEMTKVLRELWRVLKPGGLLLLAFHLGDEVLHREEMWNVKVSLDFYFFSRNEMAGYLREANFVVEEMIERDPYPEIEHQSRRAYIFARKPGVIAR